MVLPSQHPSPLVYSVLDLVVCYHFNIISILLQPCYFHSIIFLILFYYRSFYLASIQTGTTIKFDPPTSTDTTLRNGTTQTLSTKHMVISSMKQYENKSLEVIFDENFVFCFDVMWLLCISYY